MRVYLHWFSRCWKLRIFPTPVSFGAPAPYLPFGMEYRGEVKTLVSWSHGATLWWRLRDPNSNRLWLIHPCDGQTDRRTGDSPESSNEKARRMTHHDIIRTRLASNDANRGELHYCNYTVKRLKVKGLDIYIPPVTGKSWPGAVYNSKWRTEWQRH